jgi:hypothetical protein
MLQKLESMNKLYLTKLLLTFLIILLYHVSFAQGFKKEKRIYLFDLTASMTGFGGTPNIFNDVQRNFVSAIDKLENDDTEIVILTFTNRIISKGTFRAHEKLKIKQFINSLKIANGNTDIKAAWAAGQKELDATKVNYMFLLTDGRQTVGGKAAEQQLFSLIRNWKSDASGHDYYAFYVMLTPNASSDVLAKSFNNSSDVWPVKSMDIDFKFIQPSKLVFYNVKDDKEKKIPVQLKRKLPDGFLFNIALSSSPYYRLSQNTYKVENGAITLRILAQDDLNNIPEELQLSLTLSKDNNKYWDVFFTPATINLKMINKKEKVLTIYQK